MTLQASQAELVEESEQDSGDKLELTLESGPQEGGESNQQNHNQPEQPQNSGGDGGEEYRLTGEDIPEKYRNKTPKELLDIIRNQEEYTGRQANELGQLREQVGTLRGVVDNAIAATAGGEAQPTGDESAELSADDLLNDPTGSVGKAVARHLKPLEERISSLDRKEREGEFVRRHPTAYQDLNDDKFVEFVKKSPYRQRLAEKAFGDPKNIDFDAAEELWLGYEETRAPAPSGAESGSEEPNAGEGQDKQAGANRNQPSAKDVALVGSGGSGGEPADTTVYSAAALTRLQAEDPDRYYEPAFYSKIAKAFAEGRVR